MANEYLSLVIASFTEKLKLSPTVAALTLLSFANGCPDIFNSIVTAGQQEGSFLAIGSLLGAFLFTSNLVIYNVLKNSEVSV